MSLPSYAPGTTFEHGGDTFTVVMSWYEPYNASHQNSNNTTLWWRFVVKKPRGKLYYSGNHYPRHARVVSSRGYKAK